MKRHNLLKILGMAVVLGGLSPGLAAAMEGRMVVELLTPLSSESSQVGDAVTFKVVEPLMDGERVVVAAGREVQGVVTASQPSGRLGRAGRLGVEIRPEGVNGIGLPLELVRPSAKGVKGKLGAVRRAAAPFAKVGRAVLSLGGRENVPAQAAQLAAVDPELAREVAARTGSADGFAEVEFASDGKGAKVAKRGAKAIARLGGSYLNSLVNGPAGALRRGGSIEVPAGAQAEVAMVAAD